MSSSDLPLVPETILKRRHDLDEVKAKRLANAKLKGNRKVFSKSRKPIYVKKPETFLAQSKSRKQHDVRYKRVMKKGMQKRASNKPDFQTKHVVVDDDDDAVIDDDNTNTEAQATSTKKTTSISYQANSVGATMVFAIRIRDNVGMSGRIRKALLKLRLKNVHEGVFVQYTEENRKLLHLVEPWVLYGTPSKSMVEDLIHRRGHGRVNNKRVPLSDNTIIEKALGDDYGLICVEDLVHEICNNGDSFEAAATFLWPFQLTAPKTRFETQKLNDKEGRDYGDKGEAIDEYIKRML